MQSGLVVEILAPFLRPHLLSVPPTFRNSHLNIHVRRHDLPLELFVFDRDDVELKELLHVLDIGSHIH